MFRSTLTLLLASALLSGCLSSQPDDVSSSETVVENFDVKGCFAYDWEGYVLWGCPEKIASLDLVEESLDRLALPANTTGITTNFKVGLASAGKADVAIRVDNLEFNPTFAGYRHVPADALNAAYSSRLNVTGESYDYSFRADVCGVSELSIEAAMPLAGYSLLRVDVYVYADGDAPTEGSLKPSCRGQYSGQSPGLPAVPPIVP